MTTSGYYQVPLKEDDIPKSAFVCKHGHYEMTRITGGGGGGGGGGGVGAPLGYMFNLYRRHSCVWQIL